MTNPIRVPNRQTPWLAWLAVTAFVAAGLPGSALADPEDPVDPKVHKNEYRHQYVNLGVFGDQFIHCLTPGDTLNQWTGIDARFPGVDDYPCLGGAMWHYDPDDNHGDWDVWIHDYAWNGCDARTQPAQDGLCPAQSGAELGIEGATEIFMEAMTSQPWMVELKSAGLARMVTTYDRSTLTATNPDDCTPIPPNTDRENGPRVCRDKVGPQSASRITNTFGFCGQGSIDTASGKINPFDTTGGPSGPITNLQVEKQVFTDGALFYALDCPLTDVVTETVRPFYNIAANTANSVTCPDPVLNDHAVCLFNLSSIGSQCYTDRLGDNVPATNTLSFGVTAVAGEIEWTHEGTTTCKDEPVHEDWVAKDAATSTVLKGIPPEACVSVVSMDPKGARQPVVQCPLGECTVGFDYYGNRRIVKCFVEGGCTGAEVATRAALLSSVQRDVASADVLCNGASVFPSSDGGANDNAWAENTGQGPGGHPIVDSSGNVPTPGGGRYECRMTYEHDDWRSDASYLAVAACDFTELPHRPEAGGSGDAHESWWYDLPRSYCPAFRSQSTSDQLCPYAEAVTVALDPVFGVADGLAYGVAQVDEDGNGMGDAWTSEWEARISQLLAPIVDSDLDGLLNVDEFRWQLVPKCVGAFTNCQDYDDDAWTDGSEVEYWNDETNDFLSAPSVAFLDPDRNIDSNNNGVGNAYDWDSDSDDIPDGDEVQVYGTYPEFADSDCDATAVACTSSTESGNYWDTDRVGDPGKGDQMNDGAEQQAWDDLGAGLRSSDHDGDGIANALLDPDSDGDLLIDGEEFTLWNTLPHRQDSDRDGLRDDAEVRVHHTDPNDWDSDDDGMPDGWEADGNLNPLIDDAALDPDADGLANLAEYQYGRPSGWDEAGQGPWGGGTNPSDADTEGDALLDGEEALTHHTNPHAWDTDADGMADHFEATQGLDALDSGDAAEDPDGDFFDQGSDGSIEQPWPNLDEYTYGRVAGWDEVTVGPWRFGTEPLVADTDGDGAGDGQEAYFGTDARVPANVEADDDGDGLTWQEEADLGTNPSDADTDGDGLCDGSRGVNCRHPTTGAQGSMPGESDYGSIPWDTDSDSDDRSDAQEALKWDPGASGSAQDVDGDLLNGVIDSDSDNDGLTDGDEYSRTTDQALPDTDTDRLRDGDEVLHYLTDPKDSDHDNDGLSDGDEVEVHHTKPKVVDTDGDTLSDGAEVNTHGTDPLLRDSDQDTLPDNWEVAKGTQPRVADADQDPDADGLSNAREYAIGSKPMAADSEGTSGDGLPDGYEDQYSLGVTVYNPSSDPDGDSYTNLNEYNAKTHPRVADTDGDGRSDGWEALTATTDPLDPDTDKDGLGDGAEYDAWTAKGYPWNTDSDGDTLKPLRDADSDNDGLNDRDELIDAKTKPHVKDSDNDGLSDFDEVVAYGGQYNPNDADTDNDGQSDGVEIALQDTNGDFDKDGIKNGDEATYGTDPAKEDTDCDGAKDGPEYNYWTELGYGAGNLLIPDVDGDSIKDGIEIGTTGTPGGALYKTRPDVADTDNDGLQDDAEARNNVKVTCGSAQTQSTSPPDLPQAGSLLPGLTPVQGFLVGYDAEGWYVQGGYGVRLYLNDRLPATASPQDAVLALLQVQATGGGPAVGSNGKLTDPTIWDTDSDHLGDGNELNSLGSNPNVCDSDGDSLGDALEAGVPGTTLDSNNACTHLDSDPSTTTNLNNPDSDGDRIPDGKEDANRNGWADRTMDVWAYAPTVGEPDAADIDTDDDGLSDLDEINGARRGIPTLPFNFDSDRDGLSDGLELGVKDSEKTSGTASKSIDVFGHVLQTFQAYQATGASVLLPAQAPGMGNVNTLDFDSDGVIDGLEDWNPNGIYLENSYELDPVDSDVDDDGLMDGRELRIYGSYNFPTAMQRWGGSGDQLVFDAGNPWETKPKRDMPSQPSDSDGDGTSDGQDLNPRINALISLEFVKLRMNEPVDKCGTQDCYRLDLYFNPIKVEMPLISADNHFSVRTSKVYNIPAKNFVAVPPLDIAETLFFPPGAQTPAASGSRLLFDLPDDVSGMNLDRMDITATIQGWDADEHSDDNKVDFNPNPGASEISEGFSLSGEPPLTPTTEPSDYMDWNTDKTYSGSRIKNDGDEDGTIQIRFGESVPTYFLAALKEMRSSSVGKAGPPGGVCLGYNEPTC